MGETDFYVWVYTPSAVREGYLAGAYCEALGVRIEQPYRSYDWDAETAAQNLWAEIKAAAPSPTFSSPGNAFMSDALCGRLREIATGPSKATREGEG